ncbi:MAG TPA: chromosome segregation protein SMC, partial [Candidatus Limnocylindria bacterium]|nr:chromosome segregation protein SMC [Candidatus Limnocylindria bacterium]
MRIKQIELTGFKSFMEHTVLELPSGVTGIVGPNGCGKSNIVDAIRWVLGEQSPKHLRGSSMEDVIFAGNSQKGPLGMAEVSLLLELTDEDRLRAAETDDAALEAQLGGLPAELARASEILVTRRYFRSGDSEYFINRAPCRLRDITELFLGTGVGNKAYAIIEQGRVEQLVAAKPEEMRLFIEEAAGTTRFRARRVAAERKMERTRENLHRVQDVLHEQQRQIAALQRQAKRAEEYHRIKDELRELDLRLFAQKQRENREAMAAHEARIAALRDEEAALVGEIERLHAAASEARRRRVATEERLRALDEALTEARVRLADAQANQRGLDERIGTLASRREHAQTEHGVLVSRAAEAEREVAAAVEALGELDAGVAAAEEAVDAAEARAAALAPQGPECERRLEEAKDLLAASISEEVRLRNLAEALARRREELEGQQRQLEEEQRLLGARLDANAQARDATRRLLDDLEAQARAATERGEALAAARDAAEAAVVGGAAAVEEARAKVTELRSRAESLRVLQRRAEGGRRGAGSLLREGPGAQGLLADVLRVDPSLERAVAVALGVRLGDVVVTDTNAALEALRWLQRSEGGSATVLPREPERRTPAIVPVGRRLLDEIEVDPQHWALAEALLGEVLLADDLDAALAAWRTAERPVTVVTRSGEAIDPFGGITGGSEPPLEETLLARARELRDLERDLRVAEQACTELEQALAASRERLQAAERDAEAVEEERQQLRLQRLAAEKDRDRLDEERARLTAELELGALQASGLAGADGALSGEMAQLGESEARAAADVAARRLAVANAQEALAAWREEWRSAEEARRVASVALASVRERQGARVEALEGARARTQELAARLAEVQDELSTLGGELSAAQAARTEAAASCVSLEERVATLHAEREGVRATLAALESETSAEDEQERRARERLEEVRTSRNAKDLAVTEHRLELEHLVERLHERYGLGPEALDAVEFGDTPPGETERLHAEELRARLLRLGDVNPGALDELRELNERHGFLQAQRADLERSLADLQHTIATLTRTCRQRFEETFEAANKKLAEVFPKLFPGGRAHLARVPVEGDDEGGVEIVVQPAGKKLQSLALLSGGEKALTATALVFSLFLIRPTPFCLLDEVDAPLDEANIGRFNHMIREMAQH